MSKENTIRSSETQRQDKDERVKDPILWKEILFKERRCLNCLRLGHMDSVCKNPIVEDFTINQVAQLFQILATMKDRSSAHLRRKSAI